MTMEHSCEGADEAPLLSKGFRISGAGSVVGFLSGLPWWGWWAWETRRSMLRPPPCPWRCPTRRCDPCWLDDAWE